MTALISRPRVGRPPLHRSTVSFNPAIETTLLVELRRQANTTALALSTYLEQLVAAAHGYTGEHLHMLHVLPTAVPADELRTRVAALTEADAIGYTHPGRTKSFRVDEPLADIVRTRAAELGITYADYLRCIFREATGLTVRRAHQQPGLLSVPSRENAPTGEEVTPT